MPLLLASVLQHPLPGYPSYAYTGESFEAEVRKAAEEGLQELVERTRADHPGVAVDGGLRFGNAAAELVELSRRALVMVLGSRSDQAHVVLACDAHEFVLRLAAVGSCFAEPCCEDDDRAGAGLARVPQDVGDRGLRDGDDERSTWPGIAETLG